MLRLHISVSNNNSIEIFMFWMNYRDYLAQQLTCTVPYMQNLFNVSFICVLCSLSHVILFPTICNSLKFDRKMFKSVNSTGLQKSLVLVLYAAGRWRRWERFLQFELCKWVCSKRGSLVVLLLLVHCRKFLLSAWIQLICTCKK